MFRLFVKRNFGNFTIMRHAETKWNLLRKVQGCLKDPSITLSEAGRLSVQPTLMGISKPTVLVTSDLLRSQQTAEAWFGVSFDQIPVETRIEPAITEINAGQYEGKYIDSLKEDPLWNLWMKDPVNFPGFPDGENLHEFSARVLGGMANLCEEYGGTQHDVCIITHGVTMRVIKCFLAGQSYRDLWSHQVINLERIELTQQQIQLFQALAKNNLSGQTHADDPKPY